MNLYGSNWVPVKDGDDRALGLHRRHYSRRIYRDGRRPRLFVGPGEKLVLLSVGGDALFVWQLFLEIRHASPKGVNCAVFRNESEHLSSDLILDAEEWARSRWPDQTRLYTYVDPRRIRSTNPGYCFIRAGWSRTSVTAAGLFVLAKSAAGAKPDFAADATPDFSGVEHPRPMR